MSVCSKLSSCPFCGASSLTTESENGRWFVLCQACGGRGPVRESAADAGLGWRRSHSNEKLIRELIDATPSMVMVVDQDFRYLLANQALADLFNMQPDELVGHRADQVITDAGVLKFTLDSFREAFRAEGVLRVEETMRLPLSAELLHFITLKKNLKFGPDQIPAALIIASDVTALKRANKEIAARERRYIEAMAASGEGIWEMDLHNQLIAHNMHLPEIYGFDPAFYEVSTSVLSDRIHPDDRARVGETFNDFLKNGGEYESQHRVVHDDGRVIWIRSRARVAEYDETGHPLRVIGSVRDITARKTAEASLEEVRLELEKANSQLEHLVEERTSELVQLNLELQSLARRDALTGLANRLAADERLLQEFTRFQRQKQPYSVMLVDVDHFKLVNDTHGHAVGDRALMHVARLLTSNLRETDLVARYGGEEFLLLVHTQDQGAALQLAEGIRRLVEVTPVSSRLSLTISIGVSDIREQDAGAEDALKRADDQLYRAKREGRNCVRCAD